MPTNDERREVARNLRRLSSKQDGVASMLVEKHLGLVGDDRFLGNSVFTNSSVLHIADLIEPEPERSCKPNVWCDGIEECHGVYERWLAECGSCGAILSEAPSEERVMICLPNYCPNCGTRVIKHAD